MKRLVIYLDTNIYGRPFDDQSNLILRVEATACLAIFNFISQNQLTLISSDILELEISKTEPNKQKKIRNCLLLANKHVLLDNKVISLARMLTKSVNLTGPDALHLSSAMVGKASHFITQDKKILKSHDKINKLFLQQPGIHLTITDALTFIQENI